MNLYVYCRNNPVNHKDPWGLSSNAECIRQCQVECDWCIKGAIKTFYACEIGWTITTSAAGGAAGKAIGTIIPKIIGRIIGDIGGQIAGGIIDHCRRDLNNDLSSCQEVHRRCLEKCKDDPCPTASFR